MSTSTRWPRSRASLTLSSASCAERRRITPAQWRDMAAGERGSLDDLLEFIRTARGFDFTGYKRSSIERRVAKRMAEVGAGSYVDYVDYLELNAGEFAELFNTLLINVTGFFRDPGTWEHLASEVVPQLVGSRSSDA